MQFLDRCYDEVNHWKSKEIYFKFLLRHLKIVMIFGFENFLHTKEVFILVVQFSLKKAKVLKKMVIIDALPTQNPTPDILLKFLSVAQKLLSFPRSSPHAIVMFPYP